MPVEKLRRRARVCWRWARRRGGAPAAGRLGERARIGAVATSEGIQVAVHGFEGDQDFLMLETFDGLPVLGARGEPGKGVSLRPLRAQELLDVLPRQAETAFHLLAFDLRRFFDPVMSQAQQTIGQHHQNQDAGTPPDHDVIDFVSHHRITTPITTPMATHSTTRARRESRLPRAALSSACCWISRRARFVFGGERLVQLGQRVRLLLDDRGVRVNLGATVGELRPPLPSARGRHHARRARRRRGGVVARREREREWGVGSWGLGE